MLCGQLLNVHLFVFIFSNPWPAENKGLTDLFIQTVTFVLVWISNTKDLKKSLQQRYHLEIPTPSLNFLLSLQSKYRWPVIHKIDLYLVDLLSSSEWQNGNFDKSIFVFSPLKFWMTKANSSFVKSFFLFYDMLFFRHDKLCSSIYQLCHGCSNIFIVTFTQDDSKCFWWTNKNNNY